MAPLSVPPGWRHSDNVPRHGRQCVRPKSGRSDWVWPIVSAHRLTLTDCKVSPEWADRAKGRVAPPLPPHGLPRCSGAALELRPEPDAGLSEW